jgi:2-keto-4-pentenoate hydratase
MSSPDPYARRLHELHKARTEFTSVFEGEPAADLEFAYAVQDRYLGLLGLSGSPAGYKVGLTTARMQSMCGVDHPIVGAVMAKRVHRSPADIRARDYTRLGMECEIAVRIGEALPTEGPELSDPGFIAGRLDAVFAAFELIDDSNADYGRIYAASMVADNVWNAGLVLGPAAAASAIDDYANLRCVLSDATGPIDEGVSREVLGNPLLVVGWLAQRLHKSGRRLEPGQIVSTGSIIRTRFVQPGERFVFEVEGLPPAELRIS